MSPVDWDSPNWGKPGHNTHEARSGSWLHDDSEEEE